MAGEYLRRTAVTRISVSPEQAEKLEATIDEWRRGANIAVDIGWEHHETGATKVQALAYDEVRERTRLGSQHSVLATHQAAYALAGVAELLHDNRTTSKPEFTAPTVTYDQRSMTLFDDGTVSLATVDGRIRCDLVLPSNEDGYQYQYLNDENWSVTESTLTVQDGEYVLHLGFRRPTGGGEAEDEKAAEDRTVLGVDLGIENLAVTSTAHFESGGELLHTHREFERTRRGLQRTGTQSAHRTLVKRGGRERRFGRDYLHRVANRIVSEAVVYDCDVIIFEDLAYIRDAMPGVRKYHQWAHSKLVSCVDYKARDRAIAVRFVDPSNTSRRCSDCGHTTERNRTDRDLFECVECGSTANADYNAAKNIGLRFVRRGPQSSRRTGDRRLALKSGTVTPNRGFSPYPSDGEEVESTDKSLAR